jgi:hypothetical protein
MTNDISLEACVSVDLETCLIRRGLQAPPPVAGVLAAYGCPPRVLMAREMRLALQQLLDDERRLIVGQNIAYDMAVAMQWWPELRPSIFRAYRADRVLDTMLVERIIEIETGDTRAGLSLRALAAKYGVPLAKDADIQLSFGQFLGASELPPDYHDYLHDDGAATLLIFQRQMSRGLVARADLALVGRFALALRLTAAWGMRCAPAEVSALEEATRLRLAELQHVMLDCGYMRWQRGKPQPVKNANVIRAAVAAAYELPIDAEGKYAGPIEQIEQLVASGMLTETHRVSSGRVMLAESGDDLLTSLADYGEHAAVWNKDLKLFRTAVDLPMHTHFGFAATLRSTSGGGFNLQNLRRTPGVRECIRPALGAFVATDYAGLELGTMAQTVVWTLGRRGMIDRINSGVCLHSDFGRHVLGLEYADFVQRLKAGDEQCKNARAAAKPLNFGLQGGMRKPTTVKGYAKLSYGVDRPVEFWQSMIDLWYSTQTDVVAYLREYIESCRSGSGGLFAVRIPGTGITRRGCTRTAAANTGSQGPGAVVALSALFDVQEAQLLGKMPGRVAGFIHDELLTDCKPDEVGEVGEAQERIMLAAATRILPDLRMKVESAAMFNWSKKAKRAVDAQGRLVIA